MDNNVIRPHCRMDSGRGRSFTVFRQFDTAAEQTADSTSYTQFMDDAKEGKIKRVDIQGRRIMVTPQNGAEYVITSPGDIWMVDDLRKAGVQVYGKAEEEPLS